MAPVVKPSDQIREDVAKARQAHPAWRFGQAVFTCVSWRWPVYANSKRAAVNDPWKQDAKVDAFLEGLDAYVAKHPQEAQ